MATAHDVACLILERSGQMSTWKLQKLLYYSQAWHLAWDEEPLFPNRIEAWANGPVVRDIYDVHRGSFTIAPPWPEGSSDKLTDTERESVLAVLEAYGHLSGHQLSVLTHSEDPWQEARGPLSATARSSAEITPQAMHDFYAALDADVEAKPVGEAMTLVDGA